MGSGRSSEPTGVVTDEALKQVLVAAQEQAAAAAKTVAALQQLVTSKPAPPRQPPEKRLKVSVISWDMGHNPLGRAYLIADLLSATYDVELVGAQFERYGSEIWKPVQNSSIPMRTFPGSDFPEHFRTVEEVAKTIDGDIIYACKPRFPAFGLGILAKELRNRPLIIDQDDRELSFVKATAGITLDELKTRQGDDDFLTPFDRSWTQYCDYLTKFADHLTVSNPALQRDYGGEIIPHVRNERVFDPALYDREMVRARFGFEPSDKVVLFLGTPREHKGIQTVASAIRQIGDPTLKLCVIGDVPDRGLRRKFEEFGDWVRLFPSQPFDQLPETLTLADLVCVLQDPESAIAQHQIPAKITDAVAMGIPCLVTPAPPLMHLVKRGVLHATEDTPLHETMARLFSDYKRVKHQAMGNRQVFLSEFSYGAVRPRLETAIDRLVANTPSLPLEFAEMLAFQRELFSGRTVSDRRAASTARKSSLLPIPKGSTRAENPRDWAASTAAEILERTAELASQAVGEESAGLPASTPSSEVTKGGHSAAAAPSRGLTLAPPKPVRNFKDDRYDIVVFWKQNDTDIYGRRSDMLVKYLAASSRVRRVVHFDHPIDSETLKKHRKSREGSHQGPFIFRQTAARVARLKRRRKINYFTYLHRPKNQKKRRFVPQVLPTEEAYLKFVAKKLARNGIGKRKTIFWVYPKNFDFPKIADAFKPDLIVADVMDDHRTWVKSGTKYYDQLTNNYTEIMERADIVLANCQPVKDSMSSYGKTIHVLPNACEINAGGKRRRPPRDVRKLKKRKPLIGYVGNLSSRIDIDLLERMAQVRPQWNIALIGSAHLTRDILKLDVYPNVHFLGVRRYEEARRCMRGFDVAIVPHIDDPMTRTMNPLKAFNYLAENVPVVSTRIANLGELSQLVRIADDHDGFIAAVDEALAQERQKALTPEALDILRRNSWDTRVERILRIIDEYKPAADLGFEVTDSSYEQLVTATKGRNANRLV